jgi:hypothetical protein
VATPPEGVHIAAVPVGVGAEYATVPRGGETGPHCPGADCTTVPSELAHVASPSVSVPAVQVGTGLSQAHAVHEAGVSMIPEFPVYACVVKGCGHPAGFPAVAPS